ncbi:alpha/beta hydrolase family protein [Ralstonia sp. 22111]|uniref:alpha/beta hydrolase family protein n=1 Tax=Ralstonia sp. 22111 TaxID=3453878 RepID=UPI003F82A922
MLRRCLAAALAAFAVGAPYGGSANEPAAPYHVGKATRAFHPQAERHWRGARTQALITNVWYPVDISVPEVSHNVDVPGASPFRMQPSAGEAPVASTQAQYPLLLLSHGTGGTAGSLDWMAAALAAHGYIVAGVNHPGNTALEPLTREGFMLWWERATDMSEVLDGVLADPVLGAHVDRTRIGAVGFSLGGYTVLELAGARTDVAAFMAFCGSPQADAICHPPEMARAQISPAADTTRSPQTEASLARSGASYRDARIKAVFAMAPALGMAMDATSLGNIGIPVSLMAGDADVTVPVDTNARRAAKMLPKADLLLVPGASHYTFVDTCLPGAAPHVPVLCKDNPGVDRDAVHAQAVRRALDFFAATLPGQT